jgi:hypothetical protein
LPVSQTTEGGRNPELPSFSDLSFLCLVDLENDKRLIISHYLTILTL